MNRILIVALSLLVFQAMSTGCREKHATLMVSDMNMALAYADAGSFQMGSNTGDKDEYNEKPVHIVRISRPFWIGIHEVTNGQYRRFVDEARYDGSAEADDDYLLHFRDPGQHASSEDDYPLVYVSWHNALAFCRWLTERESKAGRLPKGYVYRLPTEAEWEYAARGGSKSGGFEYAGSNDVAEVAWHGGNSDDKTHPVGQKKANELGLYDMSGNVWEWCHDWYAGDYYDGSGSTDPNGPLSGGRRVFRGGSWNYAPTGSRCAHRALGTPRYAYKAAGFRVVASFPLESQESHTDAVGQLGTRSAGVSVDVERKDGTPTRIGSKPIHKRGGAAITPPPQPTRIGSEPVGDVGGTQATPLPRPPRVASEPMGDMGSKQVTPQEVPRPSAAAILTAPDLNITLLYVEPGKFQMGSDDWLDNAEPIHTVRISRGFWMGRCEVTNGQYQRFIKDSQYDGSREANSNYLLHFRDPGQHASSEDAYPLVYVSWHNAVAFCRWLTERESKAGRLPKGYVYRLPTEAEWEYAARGGGNSRGFDYAGSNVVDEVAWYWGNSSGTNGRETHPVGLKKSNELGLYDMSGNVSEWCHDWYAKDYYSKSPESDPVGPSSGESRTLRGSSYMSNPDRCGSTAHQAFRPQEAASNVGFRVTLSFPLD